MYLLCHPQRIAYSWTHGSGKFASRTDMIWSPTAMQDCIQQCEYYPSFFMDHQYLLVRSSFCDPLVTGPGVWKFNTSLLQYPEYIELVKSFWTFWSTYKEHQNFESLLNWWDRGNSTSERSLAAFLK